MIIDEMEKALRGEPSAVTLAPLSEGDIARDRNLKNRGYSFAFGRGWPSHDEFMDSLPKIEK